MESKVYQIEIYRDQSGRAPFNDWFEGLRDEAAKARIEKRLDRIENGNLGKQRRLRAGLRELIFDFGPGYRIYFCIRARTVVLLLAGSDKSKQQAVISAAMKYLDDHRRRHQ